MSLCASVDAAEAIGYAQKGPNLRCEGGHRSTMKAGYLAPFEAYRGRQYLFFIKLPLRVQNATCAVSSTDEVVIACCSVEAVSCLF
jgi:hypothetical protein